MPVDVPISQISDYVNNQDLNNHLTNIDPDSNLPLQSNFDYYSTEDFKSNNMISNCTSSKHFSILHSNISLHANFDNFMQMLAELNHKFLVIGLTETKFNIGNDWAVCQYPGISVYFSTQSI